MDEKKLTRHHGYYDVQASRGLVAAEADLGVIGLKGKRITRQERDLDYRFSTHFHPYVGRLTRLLLERSVRGLQDADTAVPPLLQEFFKAAYDPDPKLVNKPYPVKDLDFTSSGAYSAYNWELFFHVPLTVAVHLSKNQRFADAQRWLHLVFDPTDDGDGPAPERFWKVKPFRTTDVERIEEILVNLATGADKELQEATVSAIGTWKDEPFRPHAIARHRPTAYMWKVVMAYLDNLIEWGDSLFREDTGEAINEAMQLYVLAANILGPRPQAVPRKGSVKPRTYADLRADLDAFGNALVELETDIPFDILPHPPQGSGSAGTSVIASLGKTLHFCVPRNDKLLAYWDTVADRLFKIRNSLNLQGIFRQLPLFEPPIDPAMLVRAAAAGLDVAAVASGVNQPLPLVRFQLLGQKALEITQEVRSLGAQLLAAMEKEDGEALAVLRASHERAVLALSEAVRYAQWQEAIKNREALQASFTNAAQRYFHYERLLGREDGDLELPEMAALDTEGLLRMKLRTTEPSVPLRPVPVDIAEDVTGEGGGKKISAHEVEELKKLKMSRSKLNAASTSDKIGGTLALIPNFSASLEPWGLGASISFGGANLGALFSLISAFYKHAADVATYEAGRAAKVGTFARREQDWAFQSNVAAGELTQIAKQIRAAEIREAITRREWENHKRQIENAEAIELFLTDEKKGKKTNTAFYAWMKREVKGLHARCFQLAFEVAKKAERALQHELGDPEQAFLQAGYMAGKEGLLAGERLNLDIRRMEMAYHESNRREYELTRHVSLRELDPLALLSLRATGRCTVALPEALFDLDGPGHYFRRIKSVAISVPCVAGPYASVNCTATLLRSSIRKSALLDGGAYARTGSEDARFSDHFGSLQAIVTSGAQNDGGLFETNLKDERRLPFEGSGAVSEWQLALPADPRASDPQQFDYDTISDVIVHLRYTAREGGALLRNAAMSSVKALIEEARTVGAVRLLSVRHEMPAEWARFKSLPAGGSAAVFPLAIELREEHYPFWSKGVFRSTGGAALLEARILVDTAKNAVAVGGSTDGSDQAALTKGDPVAGMFGGDVKALLPGPVGKSTLHFDDNSMRDVWLALTWGKAP